MKNFKHDCDACIYLGSFEHETGKQDTYFCHNRYGGSIICRHGNEGPDYGSMPVDVIEGWNGQTLIELREQNNSITIAYDMAKEQKLIK